MQKSFFFDAELVDDEWDRAYLSSDFASYFATFIGNGSNRQWHEYKN